MPAQRTLALTIRTVEVFETSLVATLFTRELGKVSVLAKGARRLKSPLQGGLDLLGVSDIVLFPKASLALDLLVEAAPVGALCISTLRSCGPLYRLLHRRTVGRSDRLPRSASQAVRRGEDHFAASWGGGTAITKNRSFRVGVPARAGADALAHRLRTMRRPGRRGRGSRVVWSGFGRSVVSDLWSWPSARRAHFEPDVTGDPGSG